MGCQIMITIPGSRLWVVGIYNKLRKCTSDEMSMCFGQEDDGRFRPF
jgi:hypothetical protein